VSPAHVLDVLPSEAHDEVGVVQVALADLTAPVTICGQARTLERRPRAPAQGLALDHVGARGRDPRPARPGQGGARHHGPRRVAGAQEHDMLPTGVDLDTLLQLVPQPASVGS
jgi:hypothetical protein